MELEWENSFFGFEFLFPLCVLVAQSCPTLILLTVALEAPLSVEFPRQEYWNGLPLLSPVDHSDPGIELRSLALQADSLPSEPPGKPSLSIRRTRLISDCHTFIVLEFNGK